METSTNQPQFHAKNILVRYCHAYKSFGTQYPENSNLLKHFPKYYKNLSIDFIHQNPLLSKIKKIKKLKRFTGFLKEDQVIPQTMWFSLLKSHRKEIEEIPEMDSSYLGGGRSHWEKLRTKEMKLFYNITRLHFSTSRIGLTSDRWNYLSIYISNMRHLKSLKISIANDNYKEVKKIVGKLDKMERLLVQLESIKLSINIYHLDIQELFQNKSFMDHLTHLHFGQDFQKWFPFLSMIPEAYKNLRSLTIGFWQFFSENREFTDFLFSLRDHPNLEGLNLRFGKNMKEFLKIFKPQKSLRYLKLNLNISNVDETIMENLVQHWEDLNQLETLNLHFMSQTTQMLPFTRILVTKILQKVQKLKSFECLLQVSEFHCFTPSFKFPFYIDQVPHLYESLEKINVAFFDHSPYPRHVNWDLSTLKMFKNLKRIKIKGEQLRYQNMKEMLALLEKKPLSRLNLKGLVIDSKNDFKNILEEISSVQSHNLKIKLGFDFQMNGKKERRELQGLCHVIKSVKPMKGLLLSLNMNDYQELTREKVESVVKKFPSIQNCILSMRSEIERIEYRKIGGMKGELKQWEI